ncbi:MAG: hypothetical protein KJ067_07435 [Vicinamibacteria bacterium]|jgi:hypothetical protein|nr:hypothetical protein [Vicinamibacteria bacterium]
MSSSGPAARRALAASGTSALLLGLLAWSLLLPLFSVALAHDEDGVACCRRGYCCCRPHADPPGPCLRSRCGCQLPTEVVVAAPLRVEAVMPLRPHVVAAPPTRTEPAPTSTRPLSRIDEPPVPPPKHSDSRPIAA